MVNETILERVSLYKALGVIIKDNLRWNDNIDELVCKASKHLHILRVLKRAGLSDQDP